MGIGYLMTFGDLPVGNKLSTIMSIAVIQRLNSAEKQ